MAANVGVPAEIWKHQPPPTGGGLKLLPQFGCGTPLTVRVRPVKLLQLAPETSEPGVVEKHHSSLVIVWGE